MTNHTGARVAPGAASRRGVHRMQRFTKRLAIALSLGCALVAVTSPVRAQGAAGFPSKPLKIVVPLAAGGGVDTVTRKLAEKLAPALGQPVIVENRPGASGTLGVDAVAKAPPDGHTLVLSAGSTIVISPQVLRKLPYDTAKDITPVAQVGTTPLVLLVNASNPATSLKALIGAAKAKPKTLSFGSYGNASVGHLLGEALNRAAGIDLLHVPYKGAAPAITDLIGGQVDVVIADFGSARAHIGPGGRLRALALSASKRVAAYPDVPTFGEEGLSQLDVMNGWLGVFVPSKTPGDVVERLAVEIGKALQGEELKAALAELGYQATGTPTAAFARVVAQDTERWGAVIKSLGGITLE